MDDVLELESRRKIYNLVEKNPGLHLSRIAELLEMRTSLVEYHLIFLEKNQIVIPSKESGYVRYYIKGSIGVDDKRIIAILRQDVPLRIIFYLLKNLRSQHRDILQSLDVSPSTLSYHLKKLVEHGIIGVQTYGEERGYFVVNKEEIMRLLLQYKPYNLIDSFKDIWIDLKVI
jgi:predicted transcriptional regulator